jgi:F0F1-type ATP synthase membrane subunit a
LDQKVNFSKHVFGESEDTIEWDINISKQTISIWESSLESSSSHYNTIFLSIVTYAVQIFDEYKKVRIRTKTLMIQRANLRRMYGAYSTTLVESLQIVTDTLSLSLSLFANCNKGNENTAKDRCKQM